LAIRLEPLSVEQSEALLAAFFGSPGQQLHPRLRSFIVERAGGNPFYLEEVVRSLIADGVIVQEDGSWGFATEVPQVEVPVTLQALLLARVDRLEPEARRAIQEAAVIGSVFDLRLLGMVSADPGAADAALEVLVDAELLAEAPQGGQGSTVGPERRYRFTHALVQDAVYQNLLVRRRTELHTRAGQALEALCGPEPQRLEDMEALGHHWGLSSDKPRGARYLVAAGDWARAIYANADAARQYQRALETLNECEDCEAERCAVRERLADLLGPTGWREQALEHYEAALSSYARVADGPAEARVRRKMGGLHWNAGERERALACFEAGLELLGGAPDHIELAHLYQEMGRLAFRSGDSHRAVEWAERALAQAERLAGKDGEAAKEAPAAMAQAYNTLGVALARLGRLDEAVAHIERSVSVAEKEGLLQAACRGFANLGVLYSTVNPGRAIETCARGLQTAKKIGDLGFQSRLYANLAVAYCALTGRCDEEGIGAAQSAVDLDRRLGQLDHLAVPLIVLGQIYQCHGQSERALVHYREALVIAEEAAEPQLLFPCYDGLATLCFEMGDEARGEQYLLQAQEVCERAGVEPDALVVLPFLD
jgi:adenylate cyclase